MLQTIGKRVGEALAVLCLVSALVGCGGWPFHSASSESQTQYQQSQAQYQGQTMTCTQVDTRGNCIRGRGADNRVVVLFGENIHRGDQMTCVNDGATMHCVRVAAY